MKLLFLKNSKSQLQFVLERQMAKTGLLFAEVFYSVTSTLKGISVYCNRDTATDKSIINNYKHYFTNFGNGPSEEELDVYLQTLIKLKNKKSKTRDEIIQLAKLENKMKVLTSEVDRAAVNWMEQNKIYSLLNFNADKSFVIFDESSELYHDKLFYQKTLLEEILSNEVFHLIGDNRILRKDFDLATPKDMDFSPDLVYSSALLKIPCLDSLSYSQLKIIRNEFQEKLVPFYKAIDDLKTQFTSYVLTSETLNEIDKHFDSVVVPQIDFFNEFIANNIYFQQIANSSTDHKMYHFNIAFSSVKTLLKFYQHTNIITELEYENLIEKIALTKDINSGIIFFKIYEIET